MGNSISKGFVWTAVDKFANLFIQFVLGIIIARLITPEEYGVLGILMVFVNVSQVFIEGGLDSALIFKNRIDNNYLNTTFIFNFAVSLLLFIIIFLFASSIERFFSFKGLSEYIHVSSIVLVTNSLIVVPTSILKIRLNFRILTYSNISAALLSGALGIIAAYLGYGVWALIIQLLSKSVCLFFCLFIACKWAPKLQFDKSSFIELYQYGVNIFSASFFTRLLDEGTSFFIGKFLSPFSLGLYSKGRQFACLPGNAIGGIITSALFPSLSSVRGDDSRFNEVYRKVISIQALICSPLFVWLAVMADSLVRLLITDKWIDVVPIIQILSLGRLLTIAANITEQVINAKGYSTIFFRQQLLKMILKTIVIIGCLPLGIMYVVIGEALFTSVTFFITNLYAKNISEFSIAEQLKVLIPFFICSFVSGCLTYVLIGLFIQTFIKIIAGTVFFFLLYFGLLIVFERNNNELLLLYHLIKNRFLKK